MAAIYYPHHVETICPAAWDVNVVRSLIRKGINMDEIDRNNDALRKGDESLMRRRWATPSACHNDAVIKIGTTGDPEEAMRIIEAGIEAFGAEPDLMADALQWAPVGRPGDWELEGILSRGEEVPLNWAPHYADDFYVAMKGRKSTWTWRNFDFSIDYLLDKKRFIVPANKQDDIVKEAKGLAVEFAKALPSEERAYRACAAVLQAQRRFEDEEEYLRRLVDGSTDSEYEGFPLNKKKIPLPMCAMRYADILLERGAYEEAGKVADLGISWTAQAQPNCNIGYFPYVKALCADALMCKRAAEGKFPSQEDVVRLSNLYELAEGLNAGASYEETSRTRRSVVLAMFVEGGLSLRTEGDEIFERGNAETK